jgi:hypothetical protein
MRVAIAVAAITVLGFISSAQAATQQFEATVTHSPDSESYICSASLTEIPSRNALFMRSVEATAGEPAIALSGEQDAAETGTEYRLTCAIDREAAFANVTLAVRRFERGVDTSYQTHQSTVRVNARRLPAR